MFSLCFAFVFGPRAEEWQIDVYTGKMRVRKGILGIQWISYPPEQPHTVWAGQHRKSRKTAWYVTSSVSERYWFGRARHGDGSPLDVVQAIYESSVSPERRVEFLRRWHDDVDTYLEEHHRPYRWLLTRWEPTVKEPLSPQTKATADTRAGEPQAD